MFPPWLACLPDQHRSAPGVGPGVRFRSVSISQTRSLGRTDVDALVEIVVGRRARDRVVDGELTDPGSVEEPAEHQHGVGAAGQCPGSGPGSGPGATPEPFRFQESLQEDNGFLA